MWYQMQADMYKRPVAPAELGDRLPRGRPVRRYGVGVYPDLAAAAEQAVTVTDRYEPDGSAAPAYEEASPPLPGGVRRADRDSLPGRLLAGDHLAARPTAASRARGRRLRWR